MQLYAESAHLRTSDRLCLDFCRDSAIARVSIVGIPIIGAAHNPSETVGDGDLPHLNVQPRRGKSFVRPLTPLVNARGHSSCYLPFSNTSLPFGPSPVSAEGNAPLADIIIGDGAFRRGIMG